MPPHSTSPLLPISTPTAIASPYEHSPPPPPEPTAASHVQRFAIATFSLARFLRGVSLIAYPRFGLWALDIAPDGSAYMLASLIGIRDILLSGLLYTTDTANASTDPSARREVTRALATNLFSDALDAFVLIFYAAWSDDWGNPIAVIVISAVMAIFEHLTLWSYSEDDWAGQEGCSLGDDKKARMNAWLRELERYEPETYRPEQSVPPSSRASFRQYGAIV
ncbi:Ff.00g080870.m01.CDS01 [Fusarium sp. VM40]|nr:Ff.00g080870.m01.CDS01 [Fusarium sp. VM40]